jgi:hypothetical protein
MSYDYQYTAIRGIDSLPQYNATGTAASILSNRVSYFYDWKGPSVTIDTACSSSLVAVHQAVSALRNGDATMAVAAGSNLIIGPEPFVSESKVCNSSLLTHTSKNYLADADDILSSTCSHLMDDPSCGMLMRMDTPGERGSAPFSLKPSPKPLLMVTTLNVSFVKRA